MSKAGIEQVISKLLIDADFRKAVAANPREALAGYDLTAEERDQLASIDLSNVQRPDELEARISKAKIKIPVGGFD